MSTKIVKKSSRCSICSKKINITNSFDCKCDETKKYCGEHRFPDEHKCTLEKEKIKLIKVVGEKVEKI